MLGQCTGDQPGYASRRKIEPAKTLRRRQQNELGSVTAEFVVSTCAQMRNMRNSQAAGIRSSEQEMPDINCTVREGEGEERTECQ